MTTLLQLVQAATGELGLDQPNSVASSTDKQVIQLLALVNKVGNDVISAIEWEGISKEHRFTTVNYTVTGDTTADSAVLTNTDTTGVAADTFEIEGGSFPTDTFVSSVDSGTQATLTRAATETETGVTFTFSQTIYTLPSDFDRLKNRTVWDSTNFWAMPDPQTAQEWQYLKSGIIANTPRLRFRIMDGKFHIFPAGNSNVDIKFEYTSDAWINVASTPLTAFASDTDTCIFRDRTIISGLKYEFFSIKGFDIAALYKDYMTQLGFEKGIDHAASTLSIGDTGGNNLFLGNSSIPDAGFG